MTMEIGIVLADVAATTLIPIDADIGPPGVVKTVEWSLVSGATSAEIEDASVVIYPSVAEETIQNVPLQNDGGWVVSIPQGRRVKALALLGLKIAGGEIAGTSDLGVGGHRLVVSFPTVHGGGWESPRFAVPAIPAVNMAPATLVGATFSNHVLRFQNAVAASRVRVSLVDGGSPQEFVVQPAEIGLVHLSTEVSARNMKVVGPENTTLWQISEFNPDGPLATIDLRASLEQALKAKIKDSKPLSISFTVVADAPARAYVAFSRPKGNLLRVHEGIVQTVLEGDAKSIELGDALAAETPRSVVGDLTVKYAGIRILETVSDDLPSDRAMVSGRIVDSQGVLKVFPTQAFENTAPASVGVIGRAPEECELSVEFVSVIGDAAGPPAVLKVTPDNAIRTRWVDVPKGLSFKGALGLRLRATRGRFYWVCGDQPLARVAIFDPDPAGRPLLLGATVLKEVRKTESHERGFAFPADLFREPLAQLKSDLFLTVDISDLTLRYAR